MGWRGEAHRIQSALEEQIALTKEAIRQRDEALAGYAKLNEEWVRVCRERERLRAFAFGDAPEWEKANATLRHEARELRAEVERLRAAIREHRRQAEAHAGTIGTETWDNALWSVLP